MIYKLTPRIWFSDLQGANDTDAPVVIGVSNNACMTNPKVHAYFRHAAGDDDEVDGDWVGHLRLLHTIARTMIAHDMPIHIHCLSGQHRSVNVAILLACWESGWTSSYSGMFRHAKVLRGDIGRGKFARSLVKSAGVMSDEEFMKL